MQLIEPDLQGVTLEQGFLNIKKGKLDKAILIMDELIENDPYLAQAYWGRALCYECRSSEPKDMERAIADYSRSIVYAEEPSALSYGRRGILYFKTGLYEDAIKDLDLALASDLLWIEARFYRGRAYMALSRDENDAKLAIDDFTSVIRYSVSEFAPAYFWRAQALRLTNRNEEAVSDYQKAIEIDPEDALALNALAYCSEHGVGADIDMDRAEKLYTRSAELGFTVARKNLAWFYSGGAGNGDNNAALSAYWMRKAADDSDPEAQNLYGLRLMHGKGVDCDPCQAAYYFRLAAEQGYLPALCSLADCYEHGLGVEKDPCAAFLIYEKTALAGSVSAAYNLGRCYYFGIGTEENNDNAFNILKPLADCGHARAQDIVGMCYENGHGVQQNLRLAGKYYRMSYRQGHAHAAAHMASRYRFGRGVRKNLSEAVRLYKQAGEMGSGYAWYALGRLYFEDKFDYERAAAAFRLAIGKGEENLSLWLARSLIHTEECHRYTAEIRGLLQKSIENEPDGFHAAIFLSELEYYGLCGFSPSPASAVERMGKLADEKGHSIPGLSCVYYFLARANELGYGCSRNPEKAAELYIEAGNIQGPDGCRCFLAGLAHMRYQGIGCAFDRKTADSMIDEEIRAGNPSGETRLLYVWSELTGNAKYCREELLRIIRRVLRETPGDPTAVYMLYFLNKDSSGSRRYLTQLRKVLKTGAPCYRFMIERHLEFMPGRAMYPLITARVMAEYMRLEAKDKISR